MLGGTIFDYEYTKRLIFKDDTIICADGGLMHLKKMEIIPNVWIGDKDSCSFDDDEFNILTKDSKVIKLNPIKDSTDGDVAYDYVCKYRFDEVLVLGFFGTRLDHVLGNIFLLKKFADINITASAVNENNTVIFASKHNEILSGEYKYLSLIPLSNHISGVSNDGLFYSLCDDTLVRYSSRGISNKPVSDRCIIDIEKGDALIILSKD